MQVNVFIASVAANIILLFFLLRSLAKSMKLQKDHQDLHKELKIQSESLRFIKDKTSQQETQLQSLLVVISDLAKNLNTDLNEARVIEIMAERLQGLLGVQKCAIFTVQSAGKSLKHVYSFGYDTKVLDSLNGPLDKARGFIGWVLRNRQPISLFDAERDDRLGSLVEENELPLFFCQPLVFGEKIVGIIATDKVQRSLSRTEILRIFSSFSNFGSIAINNARHMEAFRERSIRDGLTNLFNHAYFHSALEARIQSLSEDRLPLTLAMFDIDDFKKLNDRYGHQAGDFILSEVSGCLLGAAQGENIAARYGGEEFALLFVGQDQEQARAAVEEIRKNVASRTYQFDQHTLRCTISAGVCGLLVSQDKVMSKEDFIRCADQCLYEAKSQGKNKVCVFKPEAF
jgi:diguanylate cyclase (GGDEF)-like protein